VLSSILSYEIPVRSSGRLAAAARRAVTLATLAFVLCLGGCGDEREDAVVGYYANIGDSRDVIEIMSGGKAKLTALAGQRLDVWERGRAQTELGLAMQNARRAMERLELVDATYEFMSERSIRFSAPGRGTRLMTIDPQSEALEDLGRVYFKRPVPKRR
jgi:hypothetical protein